MPIKFHNQVALDVFKRIQQRAIEIGCLQIGLLPACDQRRRKRGIEIEIERMNEEFRNPRV